MYVYICIYVCVCVCVCVCDVTRRNILATTVAVKKQQMLHILSVLSVRYPKRNWYAPYCHMWSACLYYNFPCYHTNGTIFEKKVIEH